MPGVIDYLTITVSDLINSNYDQLDKILSFLLSSSIFMATCGLLKTYFSYLMFGTSPDYKLLLATFLVIFAVYCINKLTDTEEDAINVPERVNFIAGKKEVLIYLSVFSYIFAIILGFSESFWIMLVLLFPLCAGIGYSISVSPKIPKLKDIFAVKSLIVALSWSIGATFLPVIGSKGISSIFIVLIFYFFFTKSFINTVLFDVRDIKGDKLSGVKTIPVGIGKEMTKKLLLIINSTLITLILLMIIFGLVNRFILILIFCIFYGYWYIFYFCNSKRIHGRLLDILVDGEWFFVFILCILIDIVL